MPSIANITAALLTTATTTNNGATMPTRTTLELKNFLYKPANAAVVKDEQRLHYVVNQIDDIITTTTPEGAVATTATAAADDNISDRIFPAFTAPRVSSLVASSAEDMTGTSFRDVTFDIFDDEHELYGSPLAFDASEHGLWNGRFVPPPPRPPFFVDEPILSDGLTTCDLCSWAMPTKSTFIFEGTIEKATELGWPLTLIIVSVLSALLGAIIMIAVVHCRRKKSHNRHDTHVQWWSRNKRSNANGTGHNGNTSNNNNHLRRSNIYTAHPADSIRGLHQAQQPTTSLSASSSLTTMTAMVSTNAANASVAGASTAIAILPSQQQQQQHQQQFFHTYHHHQQQHAKQPQQQHQQQQHHNHMHHHHHHHPHKLQLQLLQQHIHSDCVADYEDDDEEEHEYHQPQELHLQLQHQRQHSSSVSSVRSPSPTFLQRQSLSNHSSLELQPDGCHWPQATTMVVAS